MILRYFLAMILSALALAATSCSTTHSSSAILPEQQDAGGNGSNVTSAPVDVRLDVSISGLALQDLNGGASGQFGAGKWGTRVVDPIDIVDRPTLGTVTPTGPGSATITAVRTSPLYVPNKTLLLNVRYAPVVNLATGLPKTGASLRQSSELSDSDLVTCAVPFKLPAGQAPVQITSSIAMTPNPHGGYFVIVTNTVITPGDDPSTPQLETSYTRHWASRLDYAAASVSEDLDNDGDFDDETQMVDHDRDTIGDNELAEEISDDD
jgi:hypothetical protein